MFSGTNNPTADDGTIRDIAIVVPARNEQDRLPDCLTSLQNAAAHLRLRAPHIGCRIVVVLDDCTDNSATIVAHRDDITAISVGFRNAGRARRAGADAAISGTTAWAEHVWLVSTNADCRVPTTWLMNFVSAAADRYHMVLGMVRPDTEMSYQCCTPGIGGIATSRGIRTSTRRISVCGRMFTSRSAAGRPNRLRKTLTSCGARKRAPTSGSFVPRATLWSPAAAASAEPLPASRPT